MGRGHLFGYRPYFRHRFVRNRNGSVGTVLSVSSLSVFCNFCYTDLMIILFLTVAIMSFWLTGKFPHFAVRCGLLDVPNQRSAHQTIKPRGAGVVFLGIWSGATLVAASIGLLGWPQLVVLLPGVLLIASVSLMDDFYSLRARTRFIVQFLAAVCLFIALGDNHALNFGGVILPPGIFTGLLILGACLWSINLFNFMDGSDGIAGIEAIFVFGGGALFLFLAGAADVAWMALFLCGAVGGFLRWNWPSARLFMGDVGSATLGFLVVAFALMGQSYGVPLTLWLILYGVFVFDASITLIRRLLAGERWYEAHKSHAYQRVTQGGWGAHKVLGALITVNSFLLGIAMVGYIYPSILWVCALTALALLSLMYLLIEYRCPMYPIYDFNL